MDLKEKHVVGHDRFPNWDCLCVSVGLSLPVFAWEVLMWRSYTKSEGGGAALRLGVRDLIPGRYYCLGGTHRLRELGLKDKGWTS